VRLMVALLDFLGCLSKFSITFGAGRAHKREFGKIVGRQWERTFLQSEEWFGNAWMSVKVRL